jgi:hypothetical protein
VILQTMWAVVFMAGALLLSVCFSRCANTSLAGRDSDIDGETTMMIGAASMACYLCSLAMVGDIFLPKFFGFVSSLLPEQGSQLNALTSVFFIILIVAAGAGAVLWVGFKQGFKVSEPK